MAEAELLEKLRAAREEIEDVRSSLRTGRTVRVLGTVATLGIAIVYALLFIGLLKGLVGDKGQTDFRVAIAAQWEEPAVQNALRDAGTAVWEDVRPVYQEEFLETFREMDLGPVLRKEAFELGREAVPALMQGAWNKVLDLNLQNKMIKEMGVFAGEVGRVYYDELRAALDEEDLVEAYSDAMREVAENVGPAYRQALNRVAPDVFSAAESELQKLADEVLADVSGQLKTQLTDTLTAKKGDIEQQTGMTETQVEETLATVVLAVDSAVQELVKKRTWSIKPDLRAIQDLLDQIPEASEKDPDKLVDELVEISLQVMRQHLPEAPAKFEGRVGNE
ncbi:MAG: hypothetical protein QGI33_01280 [Candidatus Brocadiia bacterium]|jgi:hypothetical protein|nr:hypothetical protein [Candidatus Brocadiia bacterium]